MDSPVRPMILNPACFHCMHPIADPNEVVGAAYKGRTRNNIAWHPVTEYDLREPTDRQGWHLEITLHGRYDLTFVQVVEVSLRPKTQGEVDSVFKNPWVDTNPIKALLGSRDVAHGYLGTMSDEERVARRYEHGMLRIGNRLVMLHDGAESMSELPIVHLFVSFDNQGL